MRIEAGLMLDQGKKKQILLESETILRRCQSLAPTDPRTYVVLGKVLMQQKRYDEARQVYSEGSVATENSSPFIWSSWGWLEYKTGNMTKARKLFDAALVVDETHSCAWHKWGTLERSEGNFMRARDLWMQGIQKCRRARPQSSIAYLYNALAVMAAEVGRVEEARAWFEEGTRTLEGAASVALWQAWAVLESRQGDSTAVRYLFKRALGVNPQSRYVFLSWSMWEKAQGNVDLCTQLLKRGIELNPTDPALYQAYALVERERGDFDKATDLFELGLKADPVHLPLWQAWGCMEATRGNLDRARDLFQQGVWADPRSKSTVFIFHAWGILERNASNVSFARELFKAAIKVDPKNEKVWSAWISMEEEIGQMERAEELMIRRAEQQWEFEVPANFTTRPSTERSLSYLIDNLTRFFSVREKSEQAETLASSSGQISRSFLPDDFQPNMEAQDIIPTLSTSESKSKAAAKALVENLKPKEKTARQKAVERMLDDNHPEPDSSSASLRSTASPSDDQEVKLKSGPLRL